MATALRLRRGTTTQHGSFTGLEGEVTVDTTKDTVVVHDGSTAGGFPMARDSAVIHNTGAESASGLKTFNDGIAADTIAEKTAAAGVTIDSVLLKDGGTGIGADGSASAPSIYRASDTNTGIFFPAADTIAFAEGGAEAMRIDSSGNVGIGTTSPTTRLHVSNGNNYANLRVGNGAFASRDNNNDVYIYSNSTTAEKYLVDGEASVIAQDNGIISFYNAPSGTAGNTVTFTERARIPAAGGFQCVNSISVGNATPTTSGAGITFPATQSASSDANTLDDYEEGTWTPAFLNVGTGTYNNQVGRYTKIGNVVYAWFYVDLATTGTASGNIVITGLPFTSQNTTNLYGPSGSIYGTGWTTARTSLALLVNVNSTQTLALASGMGAVSATNVTHADLGTGTVISVLIYRTA